MSAMETTEEIMDKLRLKAIETTNEVMDKLRLNVAQLGISTIRKLHNLFAETDTDKTCQLTNEEFIFALMKNTIYLSKIDASNIIRKYKVNELEVNYFKFMDELSPPLTNEREQAVKQLFDLIQENTKQNGNIILYHDLMSLCNFNVHPAVVSAQFSANPHLVKSAQLSGQFCQEMIKSAFDSIQNDKDEITYTQFTFFFRGISSGYPDNTAAFIRFIRSCWCSMFKNVNDGNINADEANKYVEQIEAMLAEKTRQKVKGSGNESRTLLRQFKHFDARSVNYVNLQQFARTLESFGVMAPEKEMTMLFDKWCRHHEADKENNEESKRLYYRQFVQQLFKKY